MSSTGHTSTVLQVPPDKPARPLRGLLDGTSSYSQISREDLIRIVLDQEEKIKLQTERQIELERYIAVLLSKIMTNIPEILENEQQTTRESSSHSDVVTQEKDKDKHKKDTKMYWYNF